MVDTVIDAEHIQDGAMLRELYASELRRYRDAAGLTQEQLGERTLVSNGQVSMIETCRRTPGPDFTARADKALNAGGRLQRLYRMMTQAAYPDWFQDFVVMEAQAVSIQEVEIQLVPGLLQTEDYARAVLTNYWPPSSDAEIDRQIAARVDRQRILDREVPPLVWVIINEAALHMPVGGPAVMRDQLRKLLDFGKRSRVQIQILTYEGGARAPLGAPFKLLEFPARDRIAYMDGLGSGQTVDDPAAVERYVKMFDAMRARALSPEDSADLIAQMVEKL